MQVLSNACTGGNEAIVEMILKEDPDVSSHAYVALLSLCKNAKSSKSILVLLIQNLEKPGMTTNLVSDLIQTPDSDGNTCFMHACNVGHMEILCVLLEVIYLEHIPHQTEEKDVKTQKDNKDAVRKAETKKPDEYTCQPIEDVHVLFKSKNHAGQNAVELLANHFKDQWDNRETGTERDETPIKKFLSLAIVCNYKWPFLLEMMKFILPKLKSPLSLIHKYGDLIINDLHYGGIKANTDLYKDPILAHQIHNLFDLNLIGALVSMAAALKLAAIACPVESSELEEKVIEYENMVQRCIECDELEKPANVTRALTRQYELDPKVSQSVHKARAFLHGPLKLCIEHDLTKLLATPVIRKHVEDVFSESLHERVNESISSISDLVQLRSGCSSYRYCPVVMFSFESLMKIVFLGIAIVAIAVRANSNVCPASNSKDLTSWISKQVYCTDLNFLNGCLILFWATSALYEIGEILNRTNLGLGSVSQNIMQFGTETMEHLKDRWNMIDLITVVLLSIWSVSKSTSSMQMYLCLSAISLSVGILRFLSKWQKTGQVVIMYFAMLEDLLPFFFVFLIFVLGFGIALHGMFPNLDEFSSVARTFLALFDAALGQHTFGIFENKEYQFIGEILMASYIVLVMIVLINLIIARMSSTHDEISDKALEMWSKVQAKNAEEFVMNRDRHVMCMLPAPFNLIPMLVSIGELVLRTDKTVVPEGSIGIISYTGTACDWVTR